MESRLIEAPASGGVRDYKMLIGGEWVDALSGNTFESINPYTGRAWATAPEAGEEDVDRAVKAARAAIDEGPWGKMTGTERARLMRLLAALLAENAQDLATVESTDNGKLLREMGGQLGALGEWYYYFAGAADKIQGETIPSDKPNFLVYTRREPIGVVGAIAPWNSPLLLLTWKLAPALAAGCTFVAKPAEQTPASTLEFGKLFEEAGFPPGVFSVVTGIFAATGQTCMAGSRLFVHEDLHDELVGAFAEKAKSAKLGNPLEMETEVGPVAFEEQLDKVQGYISLGQEEGAELVSGGKRPDAEE